MKTSNTEKSGNSCLRFFGAENELGNAALAGILGIAAIFAVVKYGDTYLKDLNPIIYGTIIALLATVSLFCMGCSIHLRTLGERPRRHLIKELNARVRDLDNVVIEANERIKAIESRMIAKASIMTRRGTDCLGLLKKIVRAIDKRNLEIRKMLSTGNKADFIDAYELYSRKLMVAESALDTLIDSDPVPAIENFELVPVVARLLQEIESEIRKVA